MLPPPKSTFNISISCSPFHDPNQGTILPGVTRRSIIELAASLGYDVQEVPVSADEAMEADEVFTTGTAVVVSPVGSLTHKGTRRQYGSEGESGELMAV